MAKQPPKNKPAPLPTPAESTAAATQDADRREQTQIDADVTQTQAGEVRDITRETEQQLEKTVVGQPSNDEPAPAETAPKSWEQPPIGSKENPIVGIGRILHVYSPKWDGPRPGIVVGEVYANAQRYTQYANVNVFFDGTRDETVLRQCRMLPTGNTFENTPIIINPDEVETARALLGFQWWATWPPRA